VQGYETLIVKYDETQLSDYAVNAKGLFQENLGGKRPALTYLLRFQGWTRVQALKDKS